MKYLPLYVCLFTLTVVAILISKQEKVNGLTPHDRLDVHEEILKDFVRQFRELREKNEKDN